MALAVKSLVSLANLGRGLIKNATTKLVDVLLSADSGNMLIYGSDNGVKLDLTSPPSTQNLGSPTTPFQNAYAQTLTASDAATVGGALAANGGLTTTGAVVINGSNFKFPAAASGATSIALFTSTGLLSYTGPRGLLSTNTGNVLTTGTDSGFYVGQPPTGVRQTMCGGPATPGGNGLLAQPSFLALPPRPCDMLLHFDTSLTADSGNGANAPHSCTAHNTAALSTNSRFGTDCLSNPNNGASNYQGVTVAAAADLQFGTGSTTGGDFTADCWFQTTALSTTNNQYVFGTYVGTADNTSWAFEITPAGLPFLATGSTVLVTGSTVISTYTWYHVAVVRYKGVTTLYINGVSQGTYADTFTYASLGFRVGQSPVSNIYDFCGYIDEVATLKGTAWWTANFQPPNMPYTAGAASLTVAYQNVSVTTPLIGTSAQGAGLDGQKDVVGYFTSAPASVTCTASTRSYIYLNVQTGASIVSTLAPYTGFGLPTYTYYGSSQFNFDTLNNIAYLAPSAAGNLAPTPLVLVGEATTNAVGVNQVICYAYNGFFQSPAFSAPAIGQNVSFNSNLGPFDSNLSGGNGIGYLEMAATAAVSGYVNGEKIGSVVTYDGTTYQPPMVSVTPYAVSLQMGSSGSPFYFRAKGTGALATIPAGSGNFTMRLTHRRFMLGA